MQIPRRIDIKNQILNDMQAALKERGEDLPLSRFSVWGILAGVQAQALSLLYHYGAWVYRQIFPQTQDESALELEGSRNGVQRKMATQTKVKAIATGIPNSVISSGWQASVQGELFVVQDSVSIPESGSVELLLLSAAEGYLESAATMSLTRSIAGVDNELQVTEWLSGSNRESLEDYRLRVVSSRRNRPQGGSISDYIGWSLEVAGIAQVLVLSLQPGVVVVFPLASRIGDNRIPSEEKRGELEEHLNQEDLAPLGVADVVVGVFVELEMQVNVVNLYPNSVELRNNIEAAWQLYLWQRFPRQFAAQDDDTQTISKAQMLALAVSAGAKQIDIELLLDDAPQQVYPLAYNQIIKLGGVTWS